MKPENRSLSLLGVTRSKAKMFEFDVPLEHHIEIKRKPENLFPLSISILGDIAAKINGENTEEAEIEELSKSIIFSANFFDSFEQTKLITEIRSIDLLLASASYYLADLPGSAGVIARKLNNGNNSILGGGLSKLLLWILLGEYNDIHSIEDPVFSKIIQNVMRNYRIFYSQGENQDSLFSEISQLRTNAYKIGTPIQLLVSDLISAVSIKKYKYSTWNLLPKYSGLSKEKWKETLSKSAILIKELWPSQQRIGQQGVYAGESAVIQMPTSAGKTKATELIIRSSFLAARSKLAVIVAPFRALCHEIRDDLQRAFQFEDVEVTEVSDVEQVDYLVDSRPGKFQIIVVTPEKLNYILRHSPDYAKDIGLIIYDEGHQFDDKERGITYELLLTSLKSKLPKECQSILISAVVNNGKEIANWLNGDGSKFINGADILPTYRTLAFSSWKTQLGRLDYVNYDDPESLEFFVPRVFEQQRLEKKPGEINERLFPTKQDPDNPNKNNQVGKDIAIYLGIKLVKKGSVAIFCAQKKSVTVICKRIIEIYDRKLPFLSPYDHTKDQNEAEKLMRLFSSNLGETSIVAQCAKLGVFAHHNNIPRGIRLSIEYAFKKEMIGFVVCTSTLAQGVNLPIRYLIVTSTQQSDEQIKVRDFQNLVGRSGRASSNTEGSIIFSNPDFFDTKDNPWEKWRWNSVKKLLNSSSSEPCTSTLLSLISPITIREEFLPIRMDFSEFLDLYAQDIQILEEQIQVFANKHKLDQSTFNKLHGQIEWKVRIISVIESFIMAHYDDDHVDLTEEDVALLAKETFAYYLADENQKQLLVDLFISLSKNIKAKIPEVNIRKSFGKTLYGLYNSLQISRWVNETIDQLIAARTISELINTLWPLLLEHSRNSIISKCSTPEILPDVMMMWLGGKSYSEIFSLFQEKGSAIRSKSRREAMTIEHVVDLCDNGFSYEVSLLVGAIADLLEGNGSDGVDRLEDQVRFLQKQMKYGLSSPIAIQLFEMGFSDRVVAIALSPIFDPIGPDKKEMISNIKKLQENILGVLSDFPGYFSEVYMNLSSKIK